MSMQDIFITLFGHKAATLNGAAAIYCLAMYRRHDMQQQEAAKQLKASLPHVL